MKRILTLAVVVSLALGTGIHTLAGYTGADDDTQAWTEISISGKLSPRWKLKLAEEMKFGDDASEYYDTETSIGFTYKASDWFDLGFAYKKIHEKKGTTWKEEDRPYLDGTIKWNWSNWKFSDRNRFEYRIRDGHDPAMRYRNRIKFKFPVTWTEYKIQPYIADEIFVDCEEGELNRNRFYLGADGKLGKNFKVGLYYCWEANKKGDDWDKKDRNIIGMKFGFSF